ncbi:MAG: polynucleotide adenylyltransferase, partial [Deltaproteobacteria bacterium]|nr:polynucleotide adenylyltransferase [Deltaproteobacteria bacterium]
RLHLHPLALADLRDCVLRAASDHAMEDDPARVFRLARFAAMLPDWTLDPDTLFLAQKAAATERAARLPAERVCRELFKALHTPKPGRFLEVLQICAALSPWFAELEGADAIPAGPLAYHRHSVLGHTVEVMNRLAGDPLAVWMALCHDLGKTGTEADILPHHYGHEQRGVAAAEALSRRLGMPRRWREIGMLAARLHMQGGKYAGLRPGTRCDLLCSVHAARAHDAFWRLAEADSGQKLQPRADEDLRRILAVRLPKDWRGKGVEAGVRLRALRCQALTRQSGSVSK